MTPEEVFKTFDTDESGLLSYDEFRRMLPALNIEISDAKAFRYFNLCDTDGSGEIDIDEFKVALFTCDPTSGNPVGYQPSKFLSPFDAFETFDEDKSGFLDEDEFHFAMNYLGLELTDKRQEQLFSKFDYNKTGSIDFYEFRECFLQGCDIKKELEDRGVEVPLLSKRSVLEDMLREILDEDEKKERRALAEARRYKEWTMLVKEKKKLLQQAQWRAYQELRTGLDTAGQVYVFGTGTHNQFGSIPLDTLKSKTSEFQMFSKVVELWQDRVRPEQLINRLKLQRRAEEQDALVEARRRKAKEAQTLAELSAAAGAAPITPSDQEDEQKNMIDPYKEALQSKFLGLNVAVSSAALWGKRIHHATVSESVMFAMADTGEVYCLGGNNQWWNEIQPDSIYQSKWRGDTTPRSQILLGTADKTLSTAVPVSEEVASSATAISEEERKCDMIKLIAKVWNTFCILNDALLTTCFIYILILVF